MNTLVLGSNGQLGQALSFTRPAGFDYVGYDLPALDITSPAALLELCREVQPDVIVNAAAYTAVDQAESEPALSESVNADGPRHVAEAAREVGARMIHISTDFVFDGASSIPYLPESAANPLSVYGRTKRDGELAVFETLPESSVVVRTAWLYSKTGHNFVKTMLRLMRERDELRVVSDQTGCPTWANSLARTLWAFAGSNDAKGAYHWTDAGETTWHEFAVAIQQEALALGLLDKAIPIGTIATEDYPTAAQRPRYSVLDCTTTIDALGVQQANWRDNLHEMLQGMEE